MPRNDVETWRNATAGSIAVLKFDRYGHEKHEIVRGGQTISLTPDERIMNVEKASSPALDVFANGTLAPVRLLETAEDFAEISANPNLMAEAEVKELFGTHWKTFASRLSAISNPMLVKRMLAMVEGEEVTATTKQVSLLQARLLELQPPVRVETADDGDREIGVPKPITPS